MVIKCRGLEGVLGIFFDIFFAGLPPTCFGGSAHTAPFGGLARAIIFGGSARLQVLDLPPFGGSDRAAPSLPPFGGSDRAAPSLPPFGGSDRAAPSLPPVLLVGVDLPPVDFGGSGIGGFSLMSSSLAIRLLFCRPDPSPVDPSSKVKPVAAGLLQGEDFLPPFGMIPPSSNTE